ncbi:DUF4129 domain-containing protein [Haloterrigena salifodinae]|uniref:DUF4129 domain-containing protein n=1 Tax=Haloterrigena salifodinae TaxID=2675099 RepID=UPI001E48D2A1|nr:DUF4129 domain-containing protein [Haloterrigena salifodinae]
MSGRMNTVRAAVRRNGTVLIATALLSILTLGGTAAVLESTPIPSSYDAPADGTGGSGLSLMAVLILLVDALLSLFGIEADPAALATGTGSWADALVAALGVLRSVALPLLGIGVIATIVLHVRRRLPTSVSGSLVFRLGARRSSNRTSRSTATDQSWPPAEPRDDVAEAWVSMTDRLDVERPRSRTPEEWAEAAIDAGYDEEAVTTITELYRETRYGDATEPLERRRDAIRELERLEGGGDTE